jgi:hypothetical protein
MLQSSLPTLFCDTGFTGRQPEHLPSEFTIYDWRFTFWPIAGPARFESLWLKMVAGVGVAPTEAELMRLA